MDDDQPRCLTAELVFEEVGIRLGGNIWYYRASPQTVQAQRRRKRTTAEKEAQPKMHSFTLNESLGSLKMVPDILEYDALVTYMQRDCRHCVPHQMARLLFDARTQMAIGPLRKQFKALFRMHVHGERLSIEIPYVVGPHYATSMARADNDPVAAVEHATFLIERCQVRNLQIAVPRKAGGSDDEREAVRSGAEAGADSEEGAGEPGLAEVDG